jgi:superfamily I DNA/RNA helicase
VYDFEEILDIDRLRRGERTTTRYISFFESWEQFASVADPNSPSGIVDRDHVLAFELVREFGDKLRGIVELVRTESVGPMEADVILTTCHKAKGLEWDVVRMLADFPSLDQISQMKEKSEQAAAGIGGRGKKVRNWREEANILYVGLTRARDELTPPPNLRDGPAGVASGRRKGYDHGISIGNQRAGDRDEYEFDDWAGKAP